MIIDLISFQNKNIFINIHKNLLNEFLSTYSIFFFTFIFLCFFLFVCFFIFIQKLNQINIILKIDVFSFLILWNLFL